MTSLCPMPERKKKTEQKIRFKFLNWQYVKSFKIIVFQSNLTILFLLFDNIHCPCIIFSETLQFILTILIAIQENIIVAELMKNSD